MDFHLIWESVKTPARQVLLAVYAFAINWVINFLATRLGFVITEEQKVLILSWGTPIVWWFLSWIDRIIHLKNKELPKKEQNSGLLGEKGLAGF